MLETPQKLDNYSLEEYPETGNFSSQNVSDTGTISRKDSEGNSENPQRLYVWRFS